MLPGIVVVLPSDGWLDVGAAVADAGSGLTCSAVTSNLLSDVPSGVQVMSVIIGFVVGYTNALTSVGFTTSFFVTT